MKHLFIFLIFIEIVTANNIKVSAESRFIPFLHSLERVEGIRFNIHECNSSLEAFEDIKNSQSEFAIVRGDILADNIESKNLFENDAFQTYKVISKLNEKFSSYLYLFSKKHHKDAYTLLNSTQKMRTIGIGYLKDLSLLYLSAIAKEVNSEYSFHYRSYSHLESFKRLNSDRLDACYLFTSQNFATEAQQNGFSVSSIKKPERIDDKNFGKLFKNPKVFTKANGGIRVENYLIASAQLADGELKSLIGALKKKKSLSTAVDPSFGTADLRVATLSTKIEQEEAVAKAEAEQKEKELKEKEEEHEKECKDALDKSQELFAQQSFLKSYTQNAQDKIQKLLATIKKAPDLRSFLPRVNLLRQEVKENSKEATLLVKNIQNAKKSCDGTQVSININNLKVKIDSVKGTRKELAMIDSEILLKGEMNEKELEAKQEQEEKILEQEQRQLQFELEKEARARAEALQQEAIKKLENEANAQVKELKAKAEEESKGFFEKLFN